MMDVLLEEDESILGTSPSLQSSHEENLFVEQVHPFFFYLINLFQVVHFFPKCDIKIKFLCKKIFIINHHKQHCD